MDAARTQDLDRLLEKPTELEGLLEKLQAARLPSPARRKRIREEAGVSLREAAAVLSVTPMTVLRWEQGTKPRREHAMRYREFLDALKGSAE